MLCCAFWDVSGSSSFPNNHKTSQVNLQAGPLTKALMQDLDVVPRAPHRLPAAPQGWIQCTDQFQGTVAFVMIKESHSLSFKWDISIRSTLVLTLIGKLWNWYALIDIVVSWDISLFIHWFSPVWTFACQIRMSPLIPLSLGRSVNY